MSFQERVDPLDMQFWVTAGSVAKFDTSNLLRPMGNF